MMALRSLCFAAAVLAVAAQDISSVPCQQECPESILQHYDAKNCEPVFDDAVSQCCPASFKCSTAAERNVDSTGCTYKGKVYKVGENVPIADPCQAGCFCREGFEGRKPSIECANVECPSLFNRQQPGCRYIYNINQCCSVDEECTGPAGPTEAPVATPGETVSVATPRTAACESEGKQYELGDKIYFEGAPCQYCVCTKDFTDAFGANCTKIDCGMDYRYAEELDKGCTPIYFDGGCCSIEWICPKSDRVKPPAETPQADASPENQCRLGDLVAPRNGVLPTDNCNLNCVCSTPPDFTCIQYSNCEKAAEALKAGKAPKN